MTLVLSIDCHAASMPGAAIWIRQSRGPLGLVTQEFGIDGQKGPIFSCGCRLNYRILQYVIIMHWYFRELCSKIRKKFLTTPWRITYNNTHGG